MKPKTYTQQELFEIYQSKMPQNGEERNMKNAQIVLDTAAQIKKHGIDKSTARSLYDSPTRKKLVEEILGEKLPKSQKGMVEHFAKLQMAEAGLCPKNAERQGFMCYLVAYFDNPDDDESRGRFFEVVTQRKDFKEAAEKFRQKYPNVKALKDLIFDRGQVTYKAGENLLDRIQEYGI